MTINGKSASGGFATEAEITLGVLKAVEQSSAVTQRSLAGELNIALGLANAYLKRCAKKGFIKIQQVPQNRYAYYLTPNGFAEKSRLTGEYLSQSFNFFRAARSQCKEIFVLCERNGWSRVVLAGASDLAEIAILCARDHDVEIVGILSLNDSDEAEFAGLPVARSRQDLDAWDVILVTDMVQPQNAFDILSSQIPAEQLLAPRFLHISRVRPEFAEVEEGA